MAPHTRVLISFIALSLIATAHRLPAPIQEIPEPSPPTSTAAEHASTPKPRARTKEKHSDASARATPASMPSHETSPAVDTAIPKGAVHMVMHSESDLRQVFTYFRFPGALAADGTTGLYRIEVSPEGKVAAVTILKSMGSTQDTAFLKYFVTWRAVPGPLRVVDIPRRIFHFNRWQSH